jgi:hypothetical protein
MNRRGDVPTLVLPIIALVLGLAVLYSFVSFSSGVGEEGGWDDLVLEAKFQKSYVENLALNGVREVIRCDKDLAEKDLEVCSGDLRKILQKAIAKRDYGIVEGNFFGRIRVGDFEFGKDGEEYVLEIEDVFVKSEKISDERSSSAEKNFDIRVVLDKTEL